MLSRDWTSVLVDMDGDNLLDEYWSITGRGKVFEFETLGKNDSSEEAKSTRNYYSYYLDIIEKNNGPRLR